VDFAVKLAIGEGMKGEIEDLVEVQVLKKRYFPLRRSYVLSREGIFLPGTGKS